MPVLCLWPPARIHRAVFAIHKRGHLRHEQQRRQRRKATAAKHAWRAKHPDLTLRQAAVRLLNQHHQPQPNVIDSSSGDDACDAALDQWERDGRQ